MYLDSHLLRWRSLFSTCTLQPPLRLDWTPLVLSVPARSSQSDGEPALQSPLLLDACSLGEQSVSQVHDVSVTLDAGHIQDCPECKAND